MTTSPASTSCVFREKALHGISLLPPASPILNKLIHSLADDDVSYAELADWIEKDTVLAGNILRVVNSALYARRGAVSSVRHAVSMMGTVKVRNVAMSFSMARMWSHPSWPAGWSPAQFNLHGVAAAILSDLLAAELPVDYPEGAFVAGLLQNVGLILIAITLQDEYARIRHLYSQEGLPLHQCETEVLGFDHASLSEEVLRQWSLPEPIQKAVAAVSGPQPESEESRTLASLLDRANCIAAQQGITVQSWMRSEDGLPQETLAALGLGEQAERLIEAFHSEYDALRGYFSP